MTEEIGLRVVILGTNEARRNLGMVRGDINSLEASIRSVAGSSAGLGTTLTRLGSSLSSLGRTMTVAVTVPITALVGSLVSAGIQFENSFADVSKTVEGVSDRFGNLSVAGKELRSEIRGMALDIPVSASELAKLAGEAGQLGVSIEAMPKFLRTIVDLGVATNMSAETAGDAIARFANIMGVSSDQLGDFASRAGSAIVDLGNKSAATESEIVAMVYRISGAGRAVGLTAQEIIALSTSISELGVHAEMGGSAVSRILLEMSTAASEGGDKLDLFAKAAGMTADEFRNLVKSSPVQAFGKVVSGLSDMQEAGTLTSDTLSDLSLNSIRLRDVINRLGPNMSNLTENVNLANTAWSENTALTVEAQKKYKTIAAQIQLAKNAVMELGIVIFDLYRNDIYNLIQGFKKLVSGLSNLQSGTIKTIIKIGLLVAAIGPLLAIVGTLFQLVGTGITMFMSLGGIIVGISTPILIAVAALAALSVALVKIVGMKNIKKGLKEISETGKWIGKAFDFGKNKPKGNIFTGVGQAIKALTYIYKDNKRTFFSNILEAFGMGSVKAQELGMKIQNFLTPILLKLSNAFEVIGQAYRAVMIYLDRGDYELAFVAILQGVFRLLGVESAKAAEYGLAVQTFITEQFIPAVKNLINNLIQIWDTVSPYLLKFGEWFLTTALPAIIAFIRNTAIPAVIDFVKFLIKLWDDTEPKLIEFYNWFTKEALPVVVTFIKGKVIPAIKDFVTDVKNIWDNTYAKLKQFYDWFTVTALPAIINFINTFVRPQIQNFIRDLKKLWEDVYPSLQKLYDWFMTTALPKINDYLNGSSAQALLKLVDHIKKIWTDTEEARNSIYTWFTETIPTAINKYAGPIKTLLDGIKSAVEWLGTNFKAQWDKAFGGVTVPQPIQDMFRYLNDINNLLSGKALGDWISQNVFGKGGEETSGKLKPSSTHTINKNFATGGAINGPAIVGENGIEVYVPKAPGYILSNSMFRNLASMLNNPVSRNTTYNNSRSNIFSPTVNAVPMSNQMDMGTELLRLHRISQAVSNAS